MQEFNIGDRVVRFRDPYGVGRGKVGEVGIVVATAYGGKNIKVDYLSGAKLEWFIAENFKFASLGKPHKHAEGI